MKTKAWWCVAVAALAAVAGAQEARDRGDRPRLARPGFDRPPAGFWPTERMMDLAFDRMSENLAKHYSFDDAQMWNTRDLLKQRFPVWLEQNRGEIQSLMNEYFEALLANEPPSPAEVALWSQRVQPLVQEFVGLVQQTSDEMRTYMTDEQQVLLDGELAAMQVGVSYMNQRLNVWGQGGYDWETEWPRSDQFKRDRDQREQQLQQEAARAKAQAMNQPLSPGGPEASGQATPPEGAGGPAAAVKAPATKASSQPKDDWTAYVESFIQRYKLGEDQQNQARKILRSLLEQRDSYLRRKATEIAELEAKMRGAKSEDERQVFRKRFDEFNGPVERMFNQLKERLDRIPTRKQRAEAAQPEPEAGGGKGGREAKKAEAKRP